MSHYQIYIVYQYGSPKSLYSNFDPNPGVPIAAEGRGASGAEVQSTKEDRIEVGVQSTAQDRTGAEAEARNGGSGFGCVGAAGNSIKASGLPASSLPPPPPRPAPGTSQA